MTDENFEKLCLKALKELQERKIDTELADKQHLSYVAILSVSGLNKWIVKELIENCREKLYDLLYEYAAGIDKIQDIEITFFEKAEIIQFDYYVHPEWMYEGYLYGQPKLRKLGDYYEKD